MPEENSHPQQRPKKDSSISDHAKVIAQTAAHMMYAFQVHHADIAGALGLTTQEREVWRTQWNMYRRDAGVMQQSGIPVTLCQQTKSDMRWRACTCMH